MLTMITEEEERRRSATAHAGMVQVRLSGNRRTRGGGGHQQTSVHHVQPPRWRSSPAHLRSLLLFPALALLSIIQASPLQRSHAPRLPMRTNLSHCHSLSTVPILFPPPRTVGGGQAQGCARRQAASPPQQSGGWGGLLPQARGSGGLGLQQWRIPVACNC
jgi:hypothetical protein